MDDAKRDRLLQQASLAAINDVALVPLYLQIAPWAMRRDLTYTARSDERNDPSALRRASRRPHLHAADRHCTLATSCRSDPTMRRSDRVPAFAA